MGVKEEHQNEIKSDREFEQCLCNFLEVMTRCTYLRANNGYTKEVAENEEQMYRVRGKLMRYLENIRKEECKNDVEMVKRNVDL